MKNTIRVDNGITRIKFIVLIFIAILLMIFVLNVILKEHIRVYRIGILNVESKGMPLQEQLQTEVEKSYTEIGELSFDTLKNNILNEMSDEILKVYNDENDRLIVSTKDETAIINKSGDIAISNIALIPSNIKIGDYVNYKPKNNGEDESFTILPKYSGYSEEQIINAEELGGWRVLNINQENGTIDLISENNTKGIYLVGAQGYNNGVFLLNEICNKLYSNQDINATARSVSILDIQEHMINNTYWKNYENYSNEKEFLENKVYPSQYLNDSNDVREIRKELIGLQIVIL